MRIYLQVYDYELWQVVSEGPRIPMKRNEEGEEVPKPSREWNETDKKNVTLNANAINTLYCGVDNKEFIGYPSVKWPMKFGTP